MNLTDFLLSRIAEDEAASLAAVRWSEGADQWADAGEPDWEHIARWDPARVLAECEAKRAIVRLWNETEESTYGDRGPSVAAEAAYALAAVYASHPDYRQEWKA